MLSGASYVIGFEIDKDALEIAEQNIEVRLLFLSYLMSD